jgi:hypothetical protein
MSTFPTTLSDLQTYIGALVNDPSNTRYGLPIINNYLDLAQHRWNNEGIICRLTDYVACTANVYRYQLSSSLTLMPLQILRATWKGIPLIVRSKDYMDKYSSIDWTTTIGTPQEIMIDLNSNNSGLSQTGPSLILHPVPQAGDVSLYTNAVGITNQNPLGVEYLCPHTTMVSPTDQPFTVNATFINLSMNPYLAGLGLDVAASLLEPDPTPETASKAKIFRAQANAYLSFVTQMYRGLEEDAPLRFGGGRTVRPSGIASTS